MARRITTELAYQAIRIEGGLIPADELARLTTLQSEEKTEQKEAHYGIPKGLKLRDEIARYWKIAQNLWMDFQSLRQRQDLDAHQITVRDFLVPLLRDVLGFTDLTAGTTVEASGHTYNIGYAARAGRIPVILVAHSQSLDTPTERYGEFNPDTGKTRRRSPFMLAQEALNASDQSLWAIASNGQTLRILRDNPSLTRPAYVEVDLEALFSEDLYADFTAFWLLAHASRFGAPEAEPADCPWERWRTAGQEAGITIRSSLRFQVAQALRSLGTGFLSHPANTPLRKQLQHQEKAEGLGKQAFFEELLSLVYRLIFLATVEDRTDPTTGQSLIFTPGTPKDVQQRYRVGYSITWLRERAVRRSSFDTHSDLWQALSITFDGLAQGQSALGLPALGGLFDVNQCRHLVGAHIENRWLLAAIFQLGYFRQSTGLTRVNYRDMGPEELGSVYESLLELVPEIQSLSQPHTAKLAFVGDDEPDASTKGNTRKLTGSYYTPDSLVQELIKSALEPVIADTVNANPERPVDALLQLTVCDPACGSGHFLLAAARRLADEVAKLRAPGGAPMPVDYRHALRDVVSHCIYGVDKNPMAITLAKTALWLEAYTPDLPLSFIDHHLQVGDSLLGVLDPKVLENGIPDEAYSALSGDDKSVASALKKQNKADLKSWKAIAAGDLFAKEGLVTQAVAVETLADDTPEHIAAKRAAWTQAQNMAQRSLLARLADTYVAAFLMPKLADASATVPLSGYLWSMLSGQQAKNEVEVTAHSLCRMHSVFHWWLAFPQVAEQGGFSVMLGNPPWERIKLQEEEFFANRSPLVASAKNKAERTQRIEWLRDGVLLHNLNPDLEAAEGLSPPNRAEIALYEAFIVARRGAEAASLFAHSSRRFPLTGVGDVNTYALFAECFLQAVAKRGRAGFIVPTGIATDDSTKAYFGHIATGQQLVSLFDFENSEAVFPAVHRSYKFSLLTLGSALAAEFVCFATQVSHLADAQRHFRLTPDEFMLINPNTRTCPVFRSERDAELTKKLYRAAPVLIKEEVTNSEGNALNQEVNPWGISFMRMFDMSNDSGLFHDGLGVSDTTKRLPLYEAKMIHQFDHRWATYVDVDGKLGEVETADVSATQKTEPNFAVRPRYWVEEREVLARIACVPSRVAKAWLALHAATTSTCDDALSDMLLDLAGWVAGELFHREAGQRNLEGAWTQQRAFPHIQSTEMQLRSRFPKLAQALLEAGISTKKALVEFPKLAAQNFDARISDAELEALTATLQRENVALALRDLLDRWMDERSPNWLMVMRGVARATDERTMISTVIPRSALGNSAPVLLTTSSLSAAYIAALIGCANSLVLDFAARFKVGGINMNFFLVKQFPVLSPDQYTSSDLAFIVPRVLELTYTSHDLAPWAEELGYSGLPFPWCPDRRADLRAELDAYYARLYGLGRDDLRYILDPTEVMGPNYPSETFRVLKDSETRAYGEYRTRRRVLEAWDSQSQSWGARDADAH
jgi:hypothetical protein